MYTGYTYYVCNAFVQCIQNFNANWLFIQNQHESDETMRETIRNLTEQLLEQRQLIIDQQLKLQQQEMETKKLQNAMNDLEARTRKVEQRTTPAGWFLSTVSCVLL